MSFAVYSFVSTVLLFGAVTHTYIQQEYFYPTLVALSQEKIQLAVVYNFLCMVVIGLMKMVVHLFVGKLNAIEVEQLIENGRSIVADTLLFLIFYSPTINGREVATLSLIQYIGVNLILKVFHSISQIRTSRMFEVGVPSIAMTVRVGALLAILLVIDATCLVYVYSLLDKTSTFYTWLLFEFINMSISAVATGLKFSFNLVDVRFTANGWPSKSVFVFYSELLADVTQMTSYMLFMGIFFYQNPSRLPIYALADVFQVVRQLVVRLRSFKRYREITANMDAKFPDASVQEMEEAESCIICRDSLTDSCKILQCGHIFHTECLKNWALVQQICPTCRADLIPRSRPVSRAASGVRLPDPAPAGVPEEQSEEVPLRETTEVSPRSNRHREVVDAVPITTSHASDEMDVSPADLLASIEHARRMAQFYAEQVTFWSAEMKSIQQQILPPSEPESLVRVIQQLQSRVSSRAPTPETIQPVPSESVLERTETEWDEIRRARQRKYEEELRQRKSTPPTDDS